MPYDNTRTTQANRTTASPSVTTRSKQGAYITPRPARITTSASPLESEDAPSQPTPKQTMRKSLTESDATPIKTVLSPNITPRSSSRKSRVHSLSSTPNGTPSEPVASPRPKSMVVTAERTTPSMNGSKGFGGMRTQSRPHVRSGSTNSTMSSSSIQGSRMSPRQDRPPSSQGSSPTFFRADDTRALFANKTASKPTQVGSSKDANFVYANEIRERVPTKQPARPFRPKLAQNQSPTTDNSQDTAKKSPPLARLTRSSPVSTVSKSGAAGRTRSTSPLKKITTARGSIPPQRSAQASKGPGSPYRRESPVLEADSSDPIHNGNLPPSPTSTTHSSSTKQFAERLTASTSLRAPRSDRSTITGPEPKSPKQDPTAGSPRPIRDSISPKTIKPAESPTTSPLRFAPVTASTESQPDRRKVLAADARRERKVLDLEISNSSLLAINRTLEREMRKQTAELRRYRRLTSAGRLSLAAPSTRSVSGGRSVRASLDARSDRSDASDQTDSDLASTDGDTDDEEDDMADGLTLDQDGSLNALAIRRAQQRVRDEERVRSDLAKHRELLVDSQRLNQSIKRCIGWTKDLIGEGRKALSHRVRVSDLQLGGRVLAGDEVGLELGQRHGLLSPGIEKAEFVFECLPVTEAVERQVHTMEAIKGSLEESHISPELGSGEPGAEPLRYD